MRGKTRTAPPPKAEAYMDRIVELSGAKLGILSIGPAHESFHIAL